MTGLLDATANDVTALAEHGATAAFRVYTPRDFTDVDFSRDELDQLTAEIVGSD